MALGFTKQYDTSIYNENDFIEIWPEISEIGIEISEGVLETMETSTVITPGSSSTAVSYIKGCVFMLGFSDVDKGTDVSLYDQHMSNAVIRSRMVMQRMGINVALVDAIDREFVDGLIKLFNTDEDSQVLKLWKVLKENKAIAQLPSSIQADIPSIPSRSSAGVKKAETDPNASQKITAPTTSVIKGKQVQPGVNFPKDGRLANKSIQYSLSMDGSKKLSPNFKVSDFKCRDGSDIILINPALIDILERVRAHFGRPVTVLSGYRTPKYNKMLKGSAKNSQHMYGNAADIKIEGVSPKQVFDWLNSWHKGGLGSYPSFTHIDVRDTVGGDFARWGTGVSKGMA